MPQGYGYGQQGYGGGRRYQYQQATPAQRQSFFKPVPIEFLQQSIEKSQGQYDTAFAGILAAKEAAIQQEVGLNDVMRQNEIIDGGMRDIDELADQYGGDYGKASKNIARQITNIRSNPFWKSAAHLKEQQTIQQKFQLENPNAHISNDVLKQSAYDPETQSVRSGEELTFGAINRSDYAKSIDQQFKDFEGDALAIGLRTAAGKPGYLEYGTETTLTDAQVREAANTGVDAFLTSNPDYVAIGLDQGKTKAEIREDAQGLIYQQIKDKQGVKQDFRYMKDDFAFEAAKAAGKRGGSAGIVGSNAGEAISLDMNDPNKAAKDLKGKKKDIDNMKEGNLKDAAQKDYQQAVENREFMIHNVQNSPQAVDLQPFYDDYLKFAQKDYPLSGSPENIPEPMSFDEFEEEVFNSVREGDVPDREEVRSSAYGGGSNINSSARKAGRALTRGMKDFHKANGDLAQNVNVLYGEEGTERNETYVGRLNEALTDFWQQGDTSFSLPYSNRQIHDVLENDKRYQKPKDGKGKRDPEKDVIRMTDGTMDGKIMYQLVVSDKDGNRLGSEYITPDDQSVANSQTMDAARELLSYGEGTTQHDIGIQIMGNVTYGKIIQDADIYTNESGNLNIPYGSKGDISYKKVPTGGDRGFQIHTGDGSDPDDYFRTAKGQTRYLGMPVDPKTGIIQPRTEREMQKLIMDSTRKENEKEAARIKAAEAKAAAEQP